MLGTTLSHYITRKITHLNIKLLSALTFSEWRRDGGMTSSVSVV